MTLMSGGCACGKVRFQAEVESDEAYLCHCRMCQKASGNVSLALFNLKQAKVRWLSGPDWYESSPIAKRPYCSACGTALGFRFNEGSENMDLTVAAFDEPTHFRPTSHFGAESINRAWLNTEGLPETRTEEHRPLMERWEKVGGPPE